MAQATGQEKARLKSNGFKATQKNWKRVPLKNDSKIPETKNTPKKGIGARLGAQEDAPQPDKSDGIGRAKNSRADNASFFPDGLKKEFNCIQNQ